MGNTNNACQQLGVEPGSPISKEEFDAIWERYGKKKSVTEKGCLSEKAARKLLKDLAAAAAIPFSEEVALVLIKDNTTGEEGNLSYESFQKVLRSLCMLHNSTGGGCLSPRLEVSQSLAHMLKKAE